MKRRIVSIICIMFLLFAITSPISGSIFSYADEPQQEQLTQEQVLEAAISTYLNARKGWIVNQTGDSIDTVQSVMQSWINSYEFWSNTNVGNLAQFYANCIIKYNPFRISLKGPAVRALNDLYHWLVDTGKLGNLQNSSGGQTSDNIYSGNTLNGNIFTIVNGNISSNSVCQQFSASDIILGNAVNGDTTNALLNLWRSIGNNSSFDFGSDDVNQSSTSSESLTLRYTANYSKPMVLKTSYNSNAALANIIPYLNCGLYSTSSSNSPFTAYGGMVYANRVKHIEGFPIFINFRPTSNPQYYAYGWMTINYTDGEYYITKLASFNSKDTTATTSANVNLDTDNFNKTDPTPPEGDNEVTYTPEDKTTGDTFNTYNEYITNYVTKNTVINNNYQDSDEPETPGGTTPPWDGGDTTVTPDGDGFNLNLPDLTLPDLDIDWSINGLSEKFPFSIPWDLMAFFTVLNAEPETPAIEAQIDLGIVDWDIDWDLHNFDTLAALLRNLEFIGFCLALILITRSIIKG